MALGRRGNLTPLLKKISNLSADLRVSQCSLSTLSANLRHQKGYKPKEKIIGILQEISQMNKSIDCDSVMKNESDEIKN